MKKLPNNTGCWTYHLLSSSQVRPTKLPTKTVTALRQSQLKTLLWTDSVGGTTVQTKLLATTGLWNVTPSGLVTYWRFGELLPYYTAPPPRKRSPSWSYRRENVTLHLRSPQFSWKSDFSDQRKIFSFQNVCLKQRPFTKPLSPSYITSFKQFVMFKTSTLSQYSKRSTQAL